MEPTALSQSFRRNALPPLDYHGGAQVAAASAKKSAATPGLHYVTVTLDSGDDVRALAARIPGSTVLGHVGELDNVYLLAVPAHLDAPDLARLARRGQSGATERSKRDAAIDFSRASDWRPLERRMPFKPRGYVAYTDPLWTAQWHLNNTTTPGNDISVLSVWAQGVTGKNVTVAVVDDGVEYNHTDLRASFYAAGSYDFNSQTALPFPGGTDSHGTRCAGEITASANNTSCGVGIAYDAKLSGVRLLGGPVTTADEAAAFNYAYQTNAIYSCSFGPTDDGATVEAPSSITNAAMQNGVARGRGGKGSVYVFASGNGGWNGDDCNYDGFANSLWTISVGAVDHTNEIAWYGEHCAAHMVVAYSSGVDLGITTIDRNDQCTGDHSGTSAAAPVVSGIVALMLSVRPELTWRDVQDVLRKSAVPVNTADPNMAWDTVPSGLLHSEYYGYGRADAARAVQVARVHQLIPPLVTYTATASAATLPAAIRYSSLNATSNVTAAWSGANATHDLVVERVAARVWLSHPSRGQLAVALRSPRGVYSWLAAPRPLDTSSDGLVGWAFTSPKHWGEPVRGTWSLIVTDMENKDGGNGTLTAWQLEVHGHIGSENGEFAREGNFTRSGPGASPTPTGTGGGGDAQGAAGTGAPTTAVVGGALGGVAGIGIVAAAALVQRRRMRARGAQRVAAGESQVAMSTPAMGGADPIPLTRISP
ncbi:pheromone processing endoprotease [Blastocladiella emersonii ATCC 22665]|nr:pheromone processing endoprotease [Blastocladiella emersonii ATCC 22665]